MTDAARARARTLLTIAAIVASAAIATFALHTLAAPMPPPATPERVARLDEDRYLATPIVVENLTVWPVMSERAVVTEDYLTLAEAHARGLAEVRERGVDNATVGELTIANRSDRPIFVPGGTVLKGGKQDRQIGVDLVVAAKTAVPVEAYCIERGRWSAPRGGGKATKAARFEIAKPVAAKKVRVSAVHEKDQSRVWQKVDEVNAKAAKAPPTATFLATVEEAEPAVARQRSRIAAQVKSRLAALRDAAAGAGEGGEGARLVGFAYAIDGEPIAVRAFANDTLLAAHLEPFVETMSLEAQLAQARDRAAGKAVYDRPAPEAALVAMVRGIAAAESEESPGIGGRLRARRNGWGGHQALLIPMPDPDPDGGDVWVALAEDWTAPAEIEGEMLEEMISLDALGYTD